VGGGEGEREGERERERERERESMPCGPENIVFCLLDYFQFSITCKGSQTRSFSIHVL